MCNPGYNNGSCIGKQSPFGMTTLSFPSTYKIAELSLCDEICHEDADCENTTGSYMCACRPGYSGDGMNCTSSAGEKDCVYTHHSFIIIMYINNDVLIMVCVNNVQYI